MGTYLEGLTLTSWTVARLGPKDMRTKAQPGITKALSIEGRVYSDKIPLEPDIPSVAALKSASHKMLQGLNLGTRSVFLTTNSWQITLIHERAGAWDKCCCSYVWPHQETGRMPALLKTSVIFSPNYHLPPKPHFHLNHWDPKHSGSTVWCFVT